LLKDRWAEMLGASQPPFLHAAKAILIHPKAWKAVFYELRPNGVLGSSAYLLCHGAHTAPEHIHSPQTGVCCVHYVVREPHVKAQDSYLSSF
jgi:hypothetical protein